MTMHAAQVPSVSRRTMMVRLALLSALYVGDVVDVATLGYAAPAIKEQWALTVSQIGLLTSLSFVGMLIGGFVGGWCSDALGRKRIIVLAMFVAAGSSLVCAVAPNLVVLGGARLTTGLALQAVTGVLIVYAAEMFPTQSRGKYLAIVAGVGLIGVPLTAWMARLIVPSSPSAWRLLFVLGAIGIVPAVIAIFVLPESTLWRRFRESDQAPRVPALEGLRQVLRGENLRHVTVASTVMLFGILGFYGFHAWVPTLLVEKGYTMPEALNVTGIYSFAPLLGALVALPVIERWERGRLSLAVCVVIAASMVLFGLAQPVWLVITTGFVVAALLQVNTTVVYTYLPEAFPTPVRGTSAGIANSVGRLGGIANGLVIPVIFAAAGFVGVFAGTAVCLVITGGVLAVFGRRTRGRDLDATETPDPTP